MAGFHLQQLPIWFNIFPNVSDILFMYRHVGVLSIKIRILIFTKPLWILAIPSFDDCDDYDSMFIPHHCNESYFFNSTHPFIERTMVGCAISLTWSLYHFPFYKRPGLYALRVRCILCGGIYATSLPHIHVYIVFINFYILINNEFFYLSIWR